MKSIATKVSSLSIGFAVVLAVSLIGIFWNSYDTMVRTQSALLDTTLRESFDRTMQWEVDSAISMLDRVEKFRADGVVSDSVARELARGSFAIPGTARTGIFGPIRPRAITWFSWATPPRARTA